MKNMNLFMTIIFSAMIKIWTGSTRIWFYSDLLKSAWRRNENRIFFNIVTNHVQLKSTAHDLFYIIVKYNYKLFMWILFIYLFLKGGFLSFFFFVKHILTNQYPYMSLMNQS